MSRILIAGCGFVGVALATRLAARGDQVFGLRRDASALPDVIHPVSADLTRPSSLRALPDALDTIVFCPAGAGGSDEGYARLYVGGLENLLAAPSLRSTPPRRFALVSSTAVYEQTDGSWVDEASETMPTHFSGRRLLEAERVLHTSGLSGCVLRAGGIYGPGRRRLIESVERGVASYDPETPVYMNRVHRDDVAGACAHLLDHPSGAGTWVLVDRAPDDRQTVLTWLAERLDAPAPPQAQANVEGGRRGATNKRCRSDKLVASGYTFAYPTFREGYAALLKP